MKDISSILIGMIPAFLIWQTSPGGSQAFWYSGVAAVIFSLIFYHCLRRWQHPGILALLSMALPIMFYIYTATQMSLFLPIFYGAFGLTLLAGCLGAVISGNWTWNSVGLNIAYFSFVLLAAIVIGNNFGWIYVEGGLLAVASFSIARLCEVDILSWLKMAPGWIYKGMEKIWY